MNFFQACPIFIDEDGREFHMKELFRGESDEFLILVARVAYKIDTGSKIGGVLHLSNRTVSLYSITPAENEYGQIVNRYDLVKTFPIMGTCSKCSSDSLLVITNPAADIDWHLNDMINARKVHQAISAILTDNWKALLSIWCEVWNSQRPSSMWLTRGSDWTPLHSQIVYQYLRKTGESFFQSFEPADFAHDIKISDLSEIPQFPDEVACTRNPQLEVSFPELRDKNGYLVTLNDWASDLRHNPYRGMISKEVQEANRVVISNGFGNVQVHCARCNFLTPVNNPALAQRNLITELNKQSRRDLKARRLQKRADKYAASGARWSGQFNKARNIEAVSTFLTNSEETPRIYSASDVIADFSITCRNCGNLADEY